MGTPEQPAGTLCLSYGSPAGEQFRAALNGVKRYDQSAWSRTGSTGYPRMCAAGLREGVMVVRIIQLAISAGLLGAGGWLGWLTGASAGALFPPGPDGPPWLMLCALLLLAGGVVFLVSGLHPRPNRAAAIAARAEEDEARLRAAGDYYAQAGGAADRDWRSGAISPPVASTAPAPEGGADAVDPVSGAVRNGAVTSEAVRGEAAGFPSGASLRPIPSAAEPPPAPLPLQVVAPPAASGPYEAVRVAIREGRLSEAERMLETERETAEGVRLAELTGLGGDHAAAAGRPSHARWLWRLAMKRFGEAGAIDSPAARAVAESLRTSG